MQCNVDSAPRDEGMFTRVEPGDYWLLRRPLAISVNRTRRGRQTNLSK